MSQNLKFDTLCGLEIDQTVGIFVRGLRLPWPLRIRIENKWFRMSPVMSPQIRNGPIHGFYNVKMPANIRANKGDVIKLGNDKKIEKYIVETADDIWLVKSLDEK